MTDPRPARTPWLTPYLAVIDAGQTLDFYARAFGFVAGNTIEHQGRLQHAEMYYQGSIVVMFAPEGAFGSTAKAPVTSGIEAPQLFYVYVDEVDSAFARATGAGATPVIAPADMFWGDRFCAVQDPDGYRWGLARHLGKPGA